MKLSNLDPFIPITELREKFLRLPKDYLFDEQQLIEFLSQRRWPDSNRRIDRTTFWRWRHDNQIHHQKLFTRLDVLKLCRICDHYRRDGTRHEYLAMLNRKKQLASKR